MENILPNDFSTQFYKFLNKDLVNLNEIELIEHYLLFGKIEKRNYKIELPKDFSIEAYRNLNKDLSNFSNDQLLKHFYEYGKNEYRIYKYNIPLNFNHLIYKELNPDLSELKNSELEKHYYLNGIKEKRKYLFDTDLNLEKINFIDKILWINLDRAEKRRKNIESKLELIDINNIRISAIDGMNNLDKYLDNNIQFERKLSNYEIACTLSHLKAINYLENEIGEYFMICEDDISFSNLKYFKNDLEDIISNAPNFDILLLNKTYNRELPNLYNKWIDYYNSYDIHIASAVCYIISKNGIQEILKNMKYNHNNDIFIFENIKLDVSDILLFKNLNTYVYKYNFISTDASESYIHNEHLNCHIENNIRELNYILRDNLV